MDSERAGTLLVFRFVVAALATWRLAFMLAREEGPGHTFSKMRRGLGTGILGEMFSCVKCLSVWVAIPFAVFVGGTWKDVIVIALALSGVSALIDEWTKPPFEWQEDKGNGLLREESDRSND